MEIGVIGLGKMGMNLALNLDEHGHFVKGMDVSAAVLLAAKEKGIAVYETVKDLVDSFAEQRIIWLMLPAGDLTETVLLSIMPLLSPQDIVIDGGNANYKDSILRAKQCAAKGINYLDCGTSGGISGARSNACLMIGGEQKVFLAIEQLFKDLASADGYLYTGSSGSGHFLKMIHNGIEYGMMQAIGEGFQLLEQSNYNFDLAAVAGVWNHGSVIRGWLMEIIANKFSESPHLTDYRGVIGASGEGKWAVETALEMNIPVPTIALSLFMRNLSQEEDSFSAKVVSALRNGFGGHEVSKHI